MRLAEPKTYDEIERALGSGRLPADPCCQQRGYLPELNNLEKERAAALVFETRTPNRSSCSRLARKERQELELRKEGQLAALLGEALAGETPAALQRLAREDQRQAEEGLVALGSNGKTYYKLVDELTEEDMAARIAAARLREAWLAYGGGPKGEGRL